MSSEPPPPSSIDVEVLSMRELDVVSLREGAGAPPVPGPGAAQAGKAIEPPAHAGATPARSEPPPPREALVPPPQQASKKPVARLPFFQVDDPRLPPPVEEEVDLEERGPDSGLIDIRSMGSLEEKAKHEGRADAAIFNLSGGLFGSNGLGPIAPPDLNALTGAPDSARSAGAGRPAGSTRVAPVLMPSSSGPATERRQHTVALAAANRSARVGWIVALVSASAAVILLALKLGSSLGESGGPATEATATAAPPLGTSGPSAAAKPAAEPAAVEAPSSAKPSASAGKPSGGPSATPRATGPSGPAPGPAQAKAGAGPATPPATAAPAKPETETAPPSEGANFDVSAARAALTAAAGKAVGCKQPDDPSGAARVSVTFAPSGRVTSARITGPPFQGTSTGGCVASAFRGATVPPFGGSSVTVTKEVNLR